MIMAEEIIRTRDCIHLSINKGINMYTVQPDWLVAPLTFRRPLQFVQFVQLTQLAQFVQPTQSLQFEQLLQLAQSTHPLQFVHEEQLVQWALF